MTDIPSSATGPGNAPTGPRRRPRSIVAVSPAWPRRRAAAFADAPAAPANPRNR